MKFINRILPPEKSLVVFFLLLLTSYVTLFVYYRHNALVAVSLNLLTLTVLLPIFLIDGIKTFIESFSKKTFHPIHEDLSQVSVIVPSHNGEKTIGAVIRNLIQRFEPENIFISSNGSTDNTCEIARSYLVNVLDNPSPLGKVEAINRALLRVNTPYVLILDDDTLINDAIIPTNLLDEGYTAVAFRVLPIKKNFWSTLQLHEYRKSMDIGRVFHNITGTVQTVSGAIGLFNTKELVRQMFIHTGEFSGEDLQRTLLIHVSDRKKGVVMADSTVETLVPATFSQLFWQRVLGWYPGQLATLAIYKKLLFQKHIPFRLRLEALYMIVLVTAVEPLRILSLPVILFSPVFFGVFYVTYIILEAIPYFILGRKEPFWVILVSPFYGLFNSLCRAIAIIVFAYRRITYHLAAGERFDDYKQAHYVAQFTSAFVLFFFIFVGISIYVYTLILPSQVKHLVATEIPYVLPQDSVVRPIPSATPSQLVESIQVTKETPNEYTYTIVSGDNRFRLTKRAAKQYIEDNNLDYAERQINYAVTLVVSQHEGEKLRIGSRLVIPVSELQTALDSQ